MDRLEQIEKEIDKLNEFLDSKDDEFMATTNSYDEYSAKRHPYASKIDKLDRERRLIMPAVMGDKTEEDDDVMSLEDFVACCKSGGFIDYDGHGCKGWQRIKCTNISK